MISFIMWFLLAQLLPPSGVSVQAALVQKLPRCALGTGYDADKDGTIDTGCTAVANQFAATSTGYAVQADSCSLAGTAVSFSDAAADSATALRIPVGNDFLSGQIGCVGTPTAGTYTVKVRARMPNSGQGTFYFGTTPLLLNPPPTPSQSTNLFNGIQQLTYQWFTLGQTFISAGAKMTLYFAPIAGLEIDCIYIDTSAAATPQCPAATVPLVPDYVMFEINSGIVIDGSLADNDWQNANAITVFNFAGSGNVCSVKFLREDLATDRIFFGATCTDTDLRAATSAADDQNIFNGGDDYLEFSIAPTFPAVFSGSVAKYAANIAASPAILDANYDASGNLLTGFSASCSVVRAISGTLDSTANDTSWTIEGACNLPFNPAAGQFGALQVLIGDADGSGYTYDLWHGGPSDANNIAVFGSVQFSSTPVPAPPADTTAPTIGAPSLVANGNSSQQWTFTCTDAGTGCQSAKLDYDTASRSSGGYSFSQVAQSISGVKPNYVVNVTISSLSAATSYFVRGCATDGAKNSACGTEANAATTNTATFYISTTGSGSTCSSGSPCATSILSTSKPQPGDIWIIKNGTYTSGIPEINCSAGATPGTQSNPITVMAETERQAFFDTSGAQMLKISNCVFWKFYGLRGRQGDGSVGTDFIWVNNSQNITLQRLLLEKSNRTGANSSMILLYPSNQSGTQIIENEIYGCYANCILLKDQSDGSFVARNYVNAISLDGIQWDSGTNNPCAAYAVYPGSSVTLVNNLTENCTYGLDIEPNGTSVGNVWKGGISYNTDTDISTVRGTDLDHMARNTLYENSVVVSRAGGQSTPGLRIDDNNNFTGRNITVFNNGDTTAGGISAQTLSEGNGSNSATILNSAAISFSGGTGISIDGTYSKFTAGLASYGNGTAYGGGLSGLSGTTAAAAMGSCRVIIPAGSPLKGTGNGGGDIGANVLYTYDNTGAQQVTSAGKLWDSSLSGANRGKWKFGGAVIAGVNDVAGQTLQDFHTRIGFGNGSCAFPAGY